MGFLSPVSRRVETPIVLSIKDGNFAWDIKVIEAEPTKGQKQEKEKLNERKDEPGEVLHINLSVPKGALIGICGSVGSGKTSLLLACLGQLKIVSGQPSRVGKRVYVSQQSWIENASLKENILFGEKFDPKK